MTPSPSAILAGLRSRGFSVRAEAGRLLVAPVATLPAEDRAVLKAHREMLLVALAAELGDAALDAICARAEADPPDFDTLGPVVLRESVIVTPDDPAFQTLAFDPGFVRWWAEHNAAVNAKPRTREEM